VDGGKSAKVRTCWTKNVRCGQGRNRRVGEGVRGAYSSLVASRWSLDGGTLRVFF
jgi:hypothetical protein